MQDVVSNEVTEDMEAKMRLRLGKIERRNDAREESIIKTRAEQEEKGEERINNKVDQFYGFFKPEVAEIEAMFETAKSKEKTHLPDYLDSVIRRINGAQHLVTDYELYLPSSHLRNAQNNIAELNTTFQKLQDELLPKKKFGFKGKKSKAAATRSDVVDHSAPPRGEELAKLQEIAQSKTTLGDKEKTTSGHDNKWQPWCNRKDENFVLNSDHSVTGSDISLTNLENCKVRITGCPSTLHLADIRNCTIETAPVATSVFIETCQDSTLILSCQQLRLHAASQTKIYLHVTSKAIIEDSNNVGFAPNTRDYKELVENPWKVAGIEKAVNNWDKVGDFNWLATDRPSPNWHIIPDEERVQDLGSLFA